VLYVLYLSLSATRFYNAIRADYGARAFRSPQDECPSDLYSYREVLRIESKQADNIDILRP